MRLHLLATLTLLGLLAAPVQAEPGVLRVGFADDAAMDTYPSSAQVAVQAGFSYARIYLSWADVASTPPHAPENPSDPAYDWSSVDRTLAPYAGTGLEIMAQLWKTPAWANGGQDENAYARNPADFGAFAAAAARRYPQIKWWLPVNEPNRSDYVSPATIAAYEPMLQAAYAAVKSVDPTDQVVAGSTSRDLGDPGDPRDAWTWARSLASNGMPMDAYAVHPYPNWTQPIGERSDRRMDVWDVPLLQSIVGVPVMAMEFGWSTSVVSEAQQAQWLSDAIEVARCTPGLTRFTLWGFHDHPGSGDGNGQQWGRFGLLREDGSPKPSLAAVTAAMHDPISCAQVAGRVGAPNGWVPSAEASIVPVVPTGAAGGGGPDPAPPSSPPATTYGGRAMRIGVDTRGLPIDPPGGGAGGDSPTAVHAAGPMRAAVLGIVRTRRTWWAMVKLGRPMGVGGRLDRVRSGGATQPVRGLEPQPINAGVHRVRLGTLPAAASYRVTFTCRVAGMGRLVVKRLFKVGAMPAS